MLEINESGRGIKQSTIQQRVRLTCAVCVMRAGTLGFWHVREKDAPKARRGPQIWGAPCVLRIMGMVHVSVLKGWGLKCAEPAMRMASAWTPRGEQISLWVPGRRKGKGVFVNVCQTSPTFLRGVNMRTRRMLTFEPFSILIWFALYNVHVLNGVVIKA